MFCALELQEGVSQPGWTGGIRSIAFIQGSSSSIASLTWVPMAQENGPRERYVSRVKNGVEYVDKAKPLPRQRVVYLRVQKLFEIDHSAPRCERVQREKVIPIKSVA